MRILFTAIAILLFTTSAYAFDPEPGNRAAPIVGTDLVSGEVISLEEYHGKWVLLCFWKSG